MWNFLCCFKFGSVVKIVFGSFLHLSFGHNKTRSWSNTPDTRKTQMVSSFGCQTADSASHNKVIITIKLHVMFSQRKNKPLHVINILVINYKTVVFLYNISGEPSILVIMSHRGWQKISQFKNFEQRLEKDRERLGLDPTTDRIDSTTTRSSVALSFLPWILRI